MLRVITIRSDKYLDSMKAFCDNANRNLANAITLTVPTSGDRYIFTYNIYEVRTESN
jgi:hypothetical protein